MAEDFDGRIARFSLFPKYNLAIEGRSVLTRSGAAFPNALRSLRDDRAVPMRRCCVHDRCCPKLAVRPLRAATIMETESLSRAEGSRLARGATREAGMALTPSTDQAERTRGGLEFGRGKSDRPQRETGARDPDLFELGLYGSVTVFLSMIGARFVLSVLAGENSRSAKARWQRLTGRKRRKNKRWRGKMARPDGPVAVCVINLKGGVGKSTISALLARRGYTHRNLDVLAIDLDPQANLSQGLMHSSYANFLNMKRPSIVEIFNGYVPPSPHSSTPTPLGPASAVETIGQTSGRSLQLIPSRFDFSDTLFGVVRPDPRALARFLVANFRHKDLIIIDCAPTESVLTIAAYHASGRVLIPVKPEYFATVGFPLLKQSLDAFGKSNRGHNLSVCGIVINNAFYDGGNNGGPEKTKAMSDISAEALKNNWPIYKEEIYHSRGFPKIMRGDNRWSGNANYFPIFANQFFASVGL